MNKKLLIKLLILHAEHTKKLKSIDHIISHDYFRIDLFDVVMQEIGLPQELDAYEVIEDVFDEAFVDECWTLADDEIDFFNGNKPSFEAFFEVALNQAELHQD
ncbi:MAG: hypothetical protein ACPGWR_26030 [Ardenticatenaceae bacterium]